MLPRGLPPPNRSGQGEGFHSHLWHARERGAARLRIPLDGSPRGWMLNEYAPRRQGVESVRLVIGSDKFVLLMLKKWLEEHC